MPERRLELDEHPSPPRARKDQQLTALSKANEVRCGRAQLKRELAAGKADIAEVLARPPEVAQTASVHELLLAVPGIGRARVARLLVCCQITASKTVVGLSERQRGELARRLAR